MSHRLARLAAVALALAAGAVGASAEGGRGARKAPGTTREADDRAQAFKKGLRLKKAKKFEQAAKVFEAIARKSPEDAEALEQLATLQGWLGRYDDAVDTWDRALALSPENSDMRLGLGRVLYWKGDKVRALKEVAVVVAAEPKNVDACVLNGDILLALERVSEARKAYLRAQALAPDDPELPKKLARTAQASP